MNLRLSAAVVAAILIASHAGAQTASPASRVDRLRVTPVVDESFNPGFIQTRDSIVDWWIGSTDSPYDLVPIGYDVNGSAAYVTSYLTDSKTRKRDAHIVHSLT